MARLAVGHELPDLALEDHAGNPRELSALLGGDPTVLHFFRGWWCPKEQAYFRRLVALQDEADVSYTNIVSVSIDAPAVKRGLPRGRRGAVDVPLRRRQELAGRARPP